jgi:hypothetical protein
MPRLPTSYSHIQRAFACLILTLVSQTDFANGQSSVNQSTGGNCSPNIVGGGNTVICPGASGNQGGSLRPSNPRPNTSPGGPGGRWRFGVFIPTCPFQMAYSIEHQQCIPAQYLGGIIPCSADDTTYANGRYVPNCQ